MATQIVRTSKNALELNELILGFFSDVNDEEIVGELSSQVVGYVNDRLPGYVTWFPHTAELYIDLDDENEDDDDDEDIEDMIDRLISEYFDRAFEAWTQEIVTVADAKALWERINNEGE